MTSLSIANGGDQRTSRAGRTWKRLSAGDRTVSALFLMVVVIAVAGPWLAPYSTMSADSAQRLLPPSTLHWFGTDENGMDVFSRLVAAPRTDVTIALVATLLSVLIGAPLGVLTGFFESSSGSSLSDRRVLCLEQRDCQHDLLLPGADVERRRCQ